MVIKIQCPTNQKEYADKLAFVDAQIYNFIEEYKNINNNVFKN